MSDKEYKTTDTALAAYLIGQGHKLLDIDPITSWAMQLIFDNHSTHLREHIKLFELGKAEGNICDFFRIHRDLIRRIKLYQK